MSEYAIRPIAHIRCDLKEKFGVPRQAGIVEALEGRIVFEPEFRDPEALRGMEGFSHLWLIWQFSEAVRQDWSPTVRPPRLGGNTRLGVFATRSPFRPNALGLSCVRLLGLERDGELGTVLRVGGADLMDGTPIYDIKPYVPYADSHPEATGSFTERTKQHALEVDFPAALLEKLPEKKRLPLLEALSQDPRPGYQEDPERVYGMRYAEHNIRFRVAGDLLTVESVE